MLSLSRVPHNNIHLEELPKEWQKYAETCYQTFVQSAQNPVRINEVGFTFMNSQAYYEHPENRKWRTKTLDEWVELFARNFIFRQGTNLLSSSDIKAGIINQYPSTPKPIVYSVRSALPMAPKHGATVSSLAYNLR